MQGVDLVEARHQGPLTGWGVGCMSTSYKISPTQDTAKVLTLTRCAWLTLHRGKTQCRVSNQYLVKVFKLCKICSQQYTLNRIFILTGCFRISGTVQGTLHRVDDPGQGLHSDSTECQHYCSRIIPGQSRMSKNRLVISPRNTTLVSY